MTAPSLPPRRRRAPIGAPWRVLAASLLTLAAAPAAAEAPAPPPAGPAAGAGPVTSTGVLGITVRATGFGLVVAGVVPGSPAEGAGLAVGDLLVRADGRELAPLDPGEAIGLLRGQPGAPVSVEAVPAAGGAARKLSVTRRDKAEVDREAADRARAAKADPGPYGRFVATVRGTDAGRVVPALETLFAEGLGGVEPRVVARFTGQTLLARRTPEARAAWEQVMVRLKERFPDDGAVRLEEVEQGLLQAGDPAGAAEAARTMARAAEARGPASHGAALAAWDLVARAGEKAGKPEVVREAVLAGAAIQRPGLLWRGLAAGGVPRYAPVSVGDDWLPRAADLLLAEPSGRERAAALARTYLSFHDDGARAEQWRLAGLDVPAPVGDPLWPVEGAKAPLFTVRTLDDGRFDLAAERGHPVLIVFWASWCGPCRQEMPHLQELYDRLRERGLRMVALAVKDDPVKAKEAYAAGKYTFPAAMCPDEVVRAYGIGPIPATRLVDGGGHVRLARKGYSEENVAELARVAEQLVSEGADRPGAPLARAAWGARALSLRAFFAESDAASVAAWRDPTPDEVWVGGARTAPRPLSLQGGLPEPPDGVPSPGSDLLSAGPAGEEGGSRAFAASRKGPWGRLHDPTGRPTAIARVAGTVLDGVWVSAGAKSGAEVVLSAASADGSGAVARFDAAGKPIGTVPRPAPPRALAAVPSPAGAGRPARWDAVFVDGDGLHRLVGDGVSDLGGPVLPGTVSVSALPAEDPTDPGDTRLALSTLQAMAVGRAGVERVFTAVARADGALLLYSNDGTLIQRVQVNVPVADLAAADLDGDGRDELVLAAAGTGFAVLDVRLPD